MKGKIKFIFIGLVLLVVIIILCYCMFRKTNDTDKFKKEYEKFNTTNYKVDINNFKNIKYSSYDEVLNIIKNDTAVIYLGYTSDDNSRFAIDVLFKVLDNNNNDIKVYYLDIHNDRDSYVVEDDKLVYEKDEKGNEIKGSKDYFKLVEALNKYLGEYVIYFDGKEYNTREKRIPIPSLIFIKEGQILGIEYYSTNMEYEDVYSAIENYLLNMYSTTCDTGNETPC